MGWVPGGGSEDLQGTVSAVLSWGLLPAQSPPGLCRGEVGMVKPA